MTSQQRNTFIEFVLNGEHRPLQFHHGDCTGSDDQAHRIVRGLFKKSCQITLHPSSVEGYRAHNERRDPDCIVRPVLPPLMRNHYIVDETDVLFVVPSTFEEQLRSGTWATWRYAKKVHRRFYLCYPDGTLA